MDSAPSTSGGRAARKESLQAPFNVVITGGTKGVQPLHLWGSSVPSSPPQLLT